MSRKHPRPAAADIKVDTPPPAKAGPPSVPLDSLSPLGILQEANRLFFHPHGLMLVLHYDRKSGKGLYLSVADYRKEPEGVMFREEDMAAADALEKARQMFELRAEKAAARRKRWGFPVQPIPGHTFGLAGE